MEKTLIAKRIHIESLMEALHQLYHSGVEMVDIYGEKSERQDSLFLVYSREYMDEEYRDSFDDLEDMADSESPNIKIELSDEDINQIS